ncbi:MAG: magnesium/cobalt transporter CorA [Armatimonadota bacterium]|nr:magnesium/cobalt transporter CorA [Armatimonadota bacterium]
MRITVFHAQGAQEAQPAHLNTLLASSLGTIWVDITGPSEEEVRILEEVFHVHPLAIEDTRNQRQRPKVEEYPDHLFLILSPIGEEQDGLVFRQLDVFVGRNFIVTVHPAREEVIEEVWNRIAHSTAPSVSAGYLAYLLLDVTVDGYFPILDRIEEEIEELEDVVLTRPSGESLSRLFRLKRMLLEVRRVVAPQRDMFNILTRRDLPFLNHDSLQFYLRDIYDHLLRIMDMLDTFRDIVTSAVELYMSAVSNRLNQVVNRLTVLTVIIGALAVITGFYGMNFERTWPPFGASWGVLFALGSMGIVTAILLVVFRCLGWY